MLSITPTKLSDYLICAHKFRLKHIEKKGKPSSSNALTFGINIHAALQKIHNGKVFPNDEAKVREILRQNWNSSAYATEDEESDYFSKGCTALENYCNAQVLSDEQTIGTEVFMSFIVRHNNQKIRLGCKADRLAILPDQTLLIIDYKTNASGKLPTPEFLMADLSTFLYYVLTRISYPQYPNLRIKFLNVLTMADVVIEYTREQIDANKKTLWECLKNIPSEKFLPRASESCTWCDFQDECPLTNKIVDFSSI